MCRHTLSAGNIANVGDLFKKISESPAFSIKRLIFDNIFLIM